MCGLQRTEFPSQPCCLCPISLDAMDLSEWNSSFKGFDGYVLIGARFHQVLQKEFLLEFWYTHLIFPYKGGHRKFMTLLCWVHTLCLPNQAGMLGFA